MYLLLFFPDLKVKLGNEDLGGRAGIMVPACRVFLTAQGMPLDSVWNVL